MALYTIKQNDTLFKIAQKLFGDGNRYPELLDLNPQITNPNLIRTGDVLEVPDLPATIQAQQEDHTLITPDVPSEEPTWSTNKKLMVVSGLGIAAAVLWWWMGQQKAAANPSNIETEEDEFSEDERIEEEDE